MVSPSYAGMIYGEDFPSGCCTRGMLEDWGTSILVDICLSIRFGPVTVAIGIESPQVMAYKANAIGLGVMERHVSRNMKGRLFIAIHTSDRSITRSEHDPIRAFGLKHHWIYNTRIGNGSILRFLQR